MKFRGNNNFYDLKEQIKDNSKSLYRKLNVALRRTKGVCLGKLQNPFLNEKKQSLPSPKFFNPEKSL